MYVVIAYIKHILFCISLLLLSTIQTHAQSSTCEKEAVSVIEQWLSEQGDVENNDVLQEIYDRLIWRACHPYNLNTVSVSELVELPFLTQIMARNIVQYRNKNGAFRMLTDLLQVTGMDELLYDKLRPFIIIKSQTRQPKMFLNISEKPHVEVHYIGDFQVEREICYYIEDTSGGYLGSPLYLQQRYHIYTNKFSLHATMEKDKGEQQQGLWNTDYMQWGINYRPDGWLKQILIGNYNVNFGMGVGLNTSFGAFKGQNVSSPIKPKRTDIKSSRSANEISFMRGGSISFNTPFEIAFFWSKQALDASVVNAFQTRYPSPTGLHRTYNELKNRHTNERQDFGGYIMIPFRDVKVGFMYVSSIFDKAIAVDSNYYNLYNFEGKRNQVMSFYAEYGFKNFQTYLEISSNDAHAWAGIGSLSIHIHQNTALFFSYRYYDSQFNALLGQPLMERGSIPKNEIGWYIAIQHKINKRLLLSAYMDIFTFPMARFGFKRPSNGLEWLTHLVWRPYSKFKIGGLFKGQTNAVETETNTNYGLISSSITQTLTWSGRVDIEWQLSKKLRFRWRAEYKQYHTSLSISKGFLTYQDIKYELNRYVRIEGRATLYQTDDYDSRIYQYENNVPLRAFSRALSDVGYRYYILTKFDIHKNVNVWIRYSVLGRSDGAFIGSGLSAIDGSHRQDIHFAMRLSL